MTAGAWVALIIAVAAILGGFIAFGRFLQTLNGFGERLKVAEGRLDKSQGHRDAMQTQINRILDQHQTMLERLGEAKRSTEKCSEDTVDLGIAIGSKIDGVSREVNALALQLSQRIKAVETVLKLKGD
jgi:hypothetical protein